MKVGSGSAALVLIAASSVGITANARQDGQAPAVVSSPSQPPQSVALTADGIIVRGQAQVPLQPDLARITFQVRATGTDHDRAQQDSRTLAAKTQTALLRAGVAEKDVVIADQRGGFALIGAAQSGEPSAGSEPKRVYSAVTEIRTTVRNLVGLGNVLTAAYEAGANGPVYLSYELNDEKAARNAALKAAVTEAREKAQAMAEAADVGTVRLAALVENAPPSVQAASDQFTFDRGRSDPRRSEAAGGFGGGGFGGGELGAGKMLTPATLKEYKPRPVVARASVTARFVAPGLAAAAATPNR
jgi:hypothetical protein